MPSSHTATAVTFEAGSYSMTTQTETPFVSQLKNQIRKYVRTVQQDGTVGMSVDNLIQCVRPPSHTVAGAPNGTNAQWAYRQLFRDTLASMTFKGFEIL